MNVLGLNGTKVLVELNWCEWGAIGGKDENDSYSRPMRPDIAGKPPDILKLVESLKKIEDAQPALERIRASFKTFLMLTEPEAVAGVLKECGVAEPVVPEPIVNVSDAASEEF